MSKPSKGPTDNKTASGPKVVNKAPHGTNPKGIHPMTKKSGNRKMNRVLKGYKQARTGRGKNSLDGCQF